MIAVREEPQAFLFYAIIMHIVGTPRNVRPSSLTEVTSNPTVHSILPIMLVLLILSYLMSLVAAKAIPATAPPNSPQSLTAG